MSKNESMSTERERFEAWYKKRYPFQPLSRLEDGQYERDVVFDAWIVWQAAKVDAALEDGDVFVEALSALESE